MLIGYAGWPGGIYIYACYYGWLAMLSMLACFLNGYTCYASYVPSNAD